MSNNNNNNTNQLDKLNSQSSQANQTAKPAYAGKGRTIPLVLKNLIIDEIREKGTLVSVLADRHGIGANTIYKWIKDLSSNDADKKLLLLENAKLKRERAELIEMIGHLTIDVSRLGKKKNGLF
jgi:transposase-like protein